MMTEKEKILTPRVVFQLIIFIVLVPMLSLLCSWQWDWWEAWFYAMGYILGFIISRYLAWRKHPDILAERSKFLQHENTEPFDTILSRLMGVTAIAIPITAGLDARFGPSVQFSATIKIIAMTLFLAGWALGSYALIMNRFFSGMVRIQKDRGQHVVDSGPYRYVRHPGYAGGLMTYISTPLLLDSLWSLIPIVLTITLLIIRTALEDKTLQEKLEGYREYTHKVHYRLIPGIW